MKVQIETVFSGTQEIDLAECLTPEYEGQGQLFREMAKTIGRMSAALVECGALELDAAVVACGVEHRKVKRIPAKPIGAIANRSGFARETGPYGKGAWTPRPVDE